MESVLIVGLGGFIGTALRYLVGISLQGAGAWFPMPVLSVNLIGSFLFGFLIGLPSDRLSPGWMLFLIPGLLGGFTTFSAFSGDVFRLIQTQNYTDAALSFALNTAGGILLCFLGFALGR